MAWSAFRSRLESAGTQGQPRRAFVAGRSADGGCPGAASRLTAHTDILFADGLRYIAQAQAFSPGLATTPSRTASTTPCTLWRSRPFIADSRVTTRRRGGLRRRLPRIAGVSWSSRVISRPENSSATVSGADVSAVSQPAAHRSRLRRHHQREHVFALLDLGPLGGTWILEVWAIWLDSVCRGVFGTVVLDQAGGVVAAGRLARSLLLSLRWVLERLGRGG